MKKETVVTAKTIAEAVQKAVEELNAPSADAIKYTVINEPKKGGLFGIGAVMAKISAEYTTGGEITALEFIRKLVSDMQINAEITLKDGNNDDKLIDITGEGASILIGHHGDTLDSLQYLANLAANRRENGEKAEYVRMTVDIEGYRAKREEALRTLARRMADKVLRYKKSVMLEPMNPYERRIIHSEVQKIDGVSTSSIGSENNRKVVMYLEDGKSAKATKAPAEVAENDEE